MSPCIQLTLMVSIGLAVFAPEAVSSADAQHSRVDEVNEHQTVVPAEISSWRLLDQSSRFFEVPLPISSRELDRYAHILQLSDAQIVLITAVRSGYLQSCLELEKSLAPALLSAAADVTEMARADRGFAAAFERKNDLQIQFAARLVSLDEQYLAQVLASLAEKQMEAFERVCMHRVRNRCFSRFWHVPKARVDLTRLVEHLQFSPDTIRDIDALIWEYEVRVTSAFAECNRLYERVTPKLHWIAEEMLSSAKPERTSEDSKREAQMRKELWLESHLKLLAPRASALRRIARINDEMLPLILAGLPKPDADRLQAAYLKMAYARAYPDPADAQPVFDRLVSSELPEDIREAVTARWEQYRRQYDRACFMLRDAIDQRVDYHASTMLDDGWMEYQVGMSDLLNQRLAIHEAFVSELLDLLPPEAVESGKTEIERWRAQASAQRAKLEGPIMNYGN